MNKKIVSALMAAGIAASAFTLTAPAANAAQATSAHAAVAAKKLTSNDRQYLSLIRADTPSLKAVSSTTLIKSAKATCDALKADIDIIDIIGAGTDAGLTSDEITSLVAGAVVFYCPSQSYKFE